MVLAIGLGALLLVLAILRIHYRHYLKRRQGTPIPGPRQWPLVGNLFWLVKDRNNFTEVILSLTQKYGKLFKIAPFQIGVPVLFTHDPAIIKHILNDGFSSGRMGKGKELYEQYLDLFGNGIFNSNGKAWYAHRQFAKSLFTPDALRNSVNVFARHAYVLSTHLECKGQAVDMQDYFMRYTLSSFGEAGFGSQLRAIEQDENRFAIAFQYVQAKSAERGDFGGLWKYLPRDPVFYEHLKYLNGYCSEVVAQRRSCPKETLVSNTDLLSKLLLATKDDGTPFTDVEILDFIRNFLIAGRDTTAELLTWCVYMLSQHPDVEAKVLEEMAVVLGDKPLTMENVSQLRYLKAVLQETLRLYPPVPVDGISVIAAEGETLPGGYHAEKSDIVLYSAYVLHRMPEFWPDPLRFDPERFLGEPPRPYTYMPFHGGPRLCLGMDMAYLEARVALVILLRKFKFTPAPGFVPQVLVKLLLTSGNGMMMAVEPRQ